jgi:sporulation protein YlmC with PRC-barrel domain
MRILGIVSILLALMSFVALSPAIAQDADYSRALQNISRLNNLDPMQDPDYETGHEVLQSRILDGSNRVIGEVSGVGLYASGRIAYLNVDFDRLRVRGKVPVDYATLNLRRASNGYKTNFKSDQIEDMIPQMLANVSTASGDGSQIIELDSLDNTLVVDGNGQRIGKVTHVLFGNRGAQATALLVTMFIGGVGNDTVAIPFTSTNIKTSRGRATEIKVSSADAQAMRDYVLGSR